MRALRHDYASVLLERGVSIRAVAEYLGHHHPGFTLGTYAHLMPESEERARATIDSAPFPRILAERQRPYRVQRLVRGLCEPLPPDVGHLHLG